MCIAKTNDVFTVSDGKIITNSKYLDSLWISEEQSHEDEIYTLYSSEYISMGDCFYNIKIYDSIYDKEEGEDIGLLDSLFSKIEIDCIYPMRNTQNEIMYHVDGTPISAYTRHFTFFNDAVLTVFSQGGFGIVEKKYITPSKKAYRTVQLSSDKTALVFRGRQDACGLRILNIIVLYNGTATLVFNKEMEITDIKEKKNLETFVLQDNWYEECVELIPNLRNMVLGFGKITIED